MSGEELFKASIVHLILSKKPEEAFELLSKHYHVRVPKLRIGLPKGNLKNAGCYIAGKRTVYVSHRENLYNPYLLLHEFYHHLRTTCGKHIGTEKYADKFAREYVDAYKRFSKFIRIRSRSEH